MKIIFTGVSTPQSYSMEKRGNRYCRLITTLPLCLAASSAAAENVDNTSGQAKDVLTLEKMVISKESEFMKSINTLDMDAAEIARMSSSVSDTAKLLEDIPGVSLYGAGGVSGIPAIHGLADDRLKVHVNGMDITSACANHMNPPLSYIDRSNVGRITVMAGITPVSMGGDSIGGSIVVDSADPVFAAPGEDILLDGNLSAFYRSNGDAFGGSIAAGIANEHVRLDYTASHTESMNYNDANGDLVKSTAYQNQNHAAALSFQWDRQLLVIRGGQQRIPYQGFPNQRMDLTQNESTFGNILHKGIFDWGKTEANFYYETTEHSMDIEADKQPAPNGRVIKMPMETRGRNLGYKLMAEIPFSNDEHLFRFGNEFHSNRIRDYWPASPTPTPMMTPNTFINVNNGERDRVGFFGEWEGNWTSEISTLLGMRYDHTNVNAGDVQGYNTMAMMYQNDADAFNALDHERNFDTFDVTALIQYAANDMAQFEFGYARKNRAPGIYELYPWSTNPMAMGMNGSFGDGNGYVGNLDLDEETAHTVSFTAHFHDPKDDAWEFKATPYFTYVNDFIDVDRCGAAGTTCTTTFANNLISNNTFVYLQYQNHDARLWGIDASGSAKLYSDKSLGQFSASTVMSYVRGERMDGGNLYHMMPFNMNLTLHHELKSWKSALEMQFIDAQDDVQQIRNEVETSSYILLNARTSYTWNKVRLDVGLDNVLDKQYYHPLAGAYLGDQYGMNPTGNNMVPWGRNIAGMGRSVYVGLSIDY